MGTSKSYSASIKGQPQWGNLSGAVTSNCGTGSVSDKNLNDILSKYVSVVGGSGKAGRGNSIIAGRAGIRTAKNLGTFLGAFRESGESIRKALELVGITGIEGITLDSLINRLIEHCTGPASTIDDVTAKTASQKVLEDIAAEAESQEEFENNLKQILSRDSVEEIMIRYFGYYIFEHLSIMFYEKLVIEKGKYDCQDLFKQIKDYLLEKLKYMTKKNPLDRMNWSGADADRVIKNIQEDVLRVFEIYES